MKARCHEALFILLTLGLTLFALDELPPTEEPSNEWGNRFRTEAPQAWEAYRSFAKRLQGTSLLKASQQAEGGEPTVQTFRGGLKHCNGQSLSVFELASGKRSIRDYARVVNSQYAFELSRKKEDQGWVLTNLDLDLSDDEPFDPPERAESVLNEVSPHLFIHRQSLQQMLQEPKFTLKGVTPVQTGDQQLVRVEFETEHERRNYAQLQGERRMAGWVLLDPDSCWVIREADVKVGWPYGRGTIKVHNEYRKSRDGLPIPVRNIRQIRVADSTAYSDTVTEFSLYEQESVPEAEFSLSAFGLPEPPGIKWKKPIPVWMWLFGGALAVFLLSLGFRWLKRRVLATA